MNMGSSVYSTPVPANGALFINRNQLFALERSKKSHADCGSSTAGAAPAPGSHAAGAARLAAGSAADAAMTGVAADALPPALSSCGPRRPASRSSPRPAISAMHLRRHAAGDCCVARGGRHRRCALDGTKPATAREGIGESSPAVSGDLVFIGDLDGVVHAVDAATGRGRWTFKTGSEIKSSPVVVGDACSSGRTTASLRAEPRRHAGAGRPAPRRARHAGRAEGVAYVAAAATRCFAASAITDGREVFAIPSGLHRARRPRCSAAAPYFGTFENEVLAVDLGVPEGRLALHASRSRVPVLFLGRGGERTRRARRPRQAGARLDAATGKAAWTLTTRARIDSSPAVAAAASTSARATAGCMRQIRSADEKVWEFETGARSRVPGDRRRPPRHRRAGRPPVLLRAA